MLTKINVYDESANLAGTLKVDSSLLERSYIEVTLMRPIEQRKPTPEGGVMHLTDHDHDVDLATFEVGYEKLANGQKRKALKIIRFPADKRDHLSGWRGVETIPA